MEMNFKISRSYFQKISFFRWKEGQNKREEIIIISSLSLSFIVKAELR